MWGSRDFVSVADWDNRLLWIVKQSSGRPEPGPTQRRPGGSWTAATHGSRGGLVVSPLLGDREVPTVGGDRNEVRATTTGPGDVPVTSEWVPARELVVESVRPPPPQQSVAHPKPDSAFVSFPTQEGELKPTVPSSIPTQVYMQ